MKICDLHSHPTLKPYLRDKAGDQYWKKVNMKIDKLMDNLLDSQSSLDQIWKASKGTITIIALHPFEKEFGKQKILQKLALFSKKANKRLLTRVVNGKLPYHELLDYELDLFNKHKTNGTKSAKIITPDNPAINPDGLNLVLSVEGGHAFCSQKEIFNDRSRTKANSLQAAIERFKSFRNKHHPIFLTVTHIAYNYFCNQAWALPNLMIGFPFRRKDFFPKSYGIAPKGMALIKEALWGNPDKRVLIDIKHMSLVARMQYFELIKDKDIPVIASHMGVTGMKRGEIKSQIRKLLTLRSRIRVRYKKKYAYKPLTQFNTCSINLYDEDILFIMHSKGLIGVSLDERILGSSKKEFGEFVYPKEFNEAFADEPASEMLKKNSDLVDPEEDNTKLETEEVMEVDEDDMVIDYPEGGDIYHLANNMIHILKVGFENNILKPWKYMTIGSDYDGLINPIDQDDTKIQSITIDEVPALIEALPQVLIATADAAGIKSEVETNINEIISCFAHKNIEEFVDKYYLK
ncbi:hypothetical protein [Carboxylicivirga sp. RSCT41]|uniref:hypothetical protein n=1 Tax=Carboxylicivirga agarovorans TaxID=3417570 RepID=UPI003D3325FF